MSKGWSKPRGSLIAYVFLQRQCSNYLTVWSVCWPACTSAPFLAVSVKILGKLQFLSVTMKATRGESVVSSKSLLPEGPAGAPVVLPLVAHLPLPSRPALAEGM